MHIRLSVILRLCKLCLQFMILLITLNWKDCRNVYDVTLSGSVYTESHEIFVRNRFRLVQVSIPVEGLCFLFTKFQ